MDYVINQCLILIPVLNIIGSVLKGIEKIPDKFIPLALLFFGIIGAVGIMGFGIDSAVQGVLVTGTAVYSNQVAKQIGGQSS